jgi:hypothetical protein
MRFDGHHVSLDWTVPRVGALSVTPLFLGGEPREVPAGHERAGLRVLGEEEDRGAALWNALRSDQRAASSSRSRPPRGSARAAVRSSSAKARRSRAASRAGSRAPTSTPTSARCSTR